MVETRPVTVGYPEVGRAIEREFSLEALVACLDDSYTRDVPTPHQDHVVIMARLEEALAIDARSIVDARQLCGRVGVAEAALRHCCRAFLGISPRRYLRLRRLKLVRAAMLRADPVETRVGELAGATALLIPAVSRRRTGWPMVKIRRRR